jgi:hypothetical protein
MRALRETSGQSGRFLNLGRTGVGNQPCRVISASIKAPLIFQDHLRRGSEYRKSRTLPLPAKFHQTLW